MRLFAIICLTLLFLIPSVLAEVIITEALYDPITSESDTEFVELFNTADQAVNISGWSLNTTTQQILFPQNTLIPASSYFLIADIDNTNAWPVEWPAADFSKEISLPNTNSGLKLIDSSHTVVDAVGWGNPVSGLYLSTPHQHVQEGESLARKSQDGSFTNTGNNSYDFLAALPTPKNSHAADVSAEEIILHASVEGNTPLIDSILLAPDDSEAEGLQVLPLAGKIKNLTLTAILTDYDGYSDIKNAMILFQGVTYSLSLQHNLNQTSSQYVGTLPLEYYLLPGIYQLNLTVNDSSGLISSTNLSFEYLSLLAFKVDSIDLIFEAVSGRYSTILGDLDFSTADNPTVINQGNTELDFRISGTNLESSSSNIPISSLSYTFLDDDFGSSLAGNLSANPVQKDVNLPPGAMSLRELTLRLFVPLGTTAGDYAGTLYLTGVMS